MTFGSTLALKGAYEEQRLRWAPAHCEVGCVTCALEAEEIFERWLAFPPKHGPGDQLYAASLGLEWLL